MKKMVFAVLAGLFVFVVFYITQVAEAGWERCVPSDYSTIQAAINAASDGDVVIVADGTYTGAGNKNLDFGGKAITVVSENGPDNCIINCQNSGRGFYFHNGEGNSSVVDGFTIKNGNMSQAAGIFCTSSSSPTIKNCIIQDCSTSYDDGGGIYCYWYSSPKILNCTIKDNSANWSGGGISCHTYCSPEIDNCVITGNTANLKGGGIHCYNYCSPTITDCNISSNTTSNIGYGGGGIYCWSYCNPTIKSCKIQGNEAEANDGGGIHLCNADPQITNCLITGNSASSRGGGLFVYWDSDPVIINCTISKNSATNQGGGIWAYYYSDPVLKNSIIWWNTSASGKQIWVYGATMNLYKCDYATGGTEVYGSPVQHVCIHLDPKFVDKDQMDFHLLLDSPCVEHGANQYVPEDLLEDIEGHPRITDVDGNDYATVDMGAMERTTVWLIDTEGNIKNYVDVYDPDAEPGVKEFTQHRTADEPNYKMFLTFEEPLDAGAVDLVGAVAVKDTAETDAVQLTETGNNTKVFSATGGGFTVTIVNMTGFREDTHDTMEVQVVCTEAGITTQDGNVVLDEFSEEPPIFGSRIIRMQFELTENVTGPDTAKFCLYDNMEPTAIGYDLMENGPGTNVFVDGAGDCEVRLSIGGGGWLNPYLPDWVEVRVTEIYYNLNQYSISLLETDSNNKIFNNEPELEETLYSTDPQPNHIFRPRVYWPEAGEVAFATITLETSLDSTNVTLYREAPGSPYFISSNPWLAVPEGVTSVTGYDIIHTVQSPTIDTVGAMFQQDEEKEEKKEKDTRPIAALARGYGDYKAVKIQTDPRHPLHGLVKKVPVHISNLKDIVDDDLDYHVESTEMLKKKWFDDKAAKAIIWYSFSHTYMKRAQSIVDFRGIWSKDVLPNGKGFSLKIGEDDVDDAVSNDYELVFVNGCASAETNAAGTAYKTFITEEWIPAWQAKCYVGWSKVVTETVEAVDFAEKFFEALDAAETEKVKPKTKDAHNVAKKYLTDLKTANGTSLEKKARITGKDVNNYNITIDRK